MSCGVGCSRGSTPGLLWLWRRLTATAPIRPLVWEPLYAVGSALENTKIKCIAEFVFQKGRIKECGESQIPEAGMKLKARAVILK